MREPAFVRDQGRIRRDGEWTVAKGEYILGGGMEEVHLVAGGILIGQGFFHFPEASVGCTRHTLAAPCRVQANATQPTLWLSSTGGFAHCTILLGRSWYKVESIL